MKTIEINNKHYKEVSVVILSEKSNNILISDRKHLILQDNKLFNPFKNEYYNLYLLSDEEIVEGDWNYDRTTKRIYKAKRCYKPTEDSQWLKVIATTDSSLETFTSSVLKLEDGSYGFTTLKPFEIPQSFIQQYIDSYNNGNVIDELYVEIEDKSVVNGAKSFISRKGNKVDITCLIKLNEDNQVITLIK